MTYRDREKHALRELAFATLSDPKAARDHAEALARLVAGDADPDLNLLEPHERGALEYLLGKVLGVLDQPLPR